MKPEERDELLVEIHTHVSYLRKESETQDKRITVLEHWRTGIVASCTSVMGAVGMWLKLGGNGQ